MIGTMLLPMGSTLLRTLHPCPSRNYYAVEHFPLAGTEAGALFSCFTLGCSVYVLGALNNLIYSYVGRESERDPTGRNKAHGAKMRKLWAVRAAVSYFFQWALIAVFFSNLSIIVTFVIMVVIAVSRQTSR